MNEELTCALCSEKPLVKYFHDDKGWIWLCMDHSAERGNATAMHLKTMQWIDGMLEPVINVEAVQ